MVETPLALNQTAKMQFGISSVEIINCILYSSFMSMTPKQETFASLLASDNPPTLIEAYEKAGYSVRRKDGKVVKKCYENARVLARTSIVTQRVKELNDKREERFSAERIRVSNREEARRDKIIKELETLSFSDDENAQVRLKALHLLGQTLGLYTERVVTKEEPKDSATLEQELLKKMSEWFPDQVQ
tara:strand:- start:752 stop:1315 length:564 start_codon:yes stop_codon:yes gene_type:complete